MPPIFEILHKDVCGRIGRLKTPHGTVETPLIMPVVNPNLQVITPAEMEQMGAKMLITNAYILHHTGETRDVHSLLGFHGPIMTDSGSYQLSVYGEIEVTSREILEFQQKIGSDIGVPLDIPTPPFAPKERAEADLKLTLQRLQEATAFQSEKMLICGPIQGSTHPDLREKAARRAAELGFDIYPIGGVVPLMENYHYQELVDVIVKVKENLPPSSPVHLFGAGHPMMLPLAVALGCDLFDSAAYILYARDKRYLTPTGTRHIQDLRYLPCNCQVCTNHTPRELEENTTLLAKHNLLLTLREMEAIKQALWEGRLWEYTAQRCHSHPHLLEGLHQALKYQDWLEKTTPRGGRTPIFYTGRETCQRTEIKRHKKKLANLTLTGHILLKPPDAKIKNTGSQTWHLQPPLIYPVELKETYPLNMVTPRNPDPQALETAIQQILYLLEHNPQTKFTIAWKKQWNQPPTDLAKKAEIIPC